MKKQNQFTIFSFGYWGWGTQVPEMVRMMDQVERSRGYAPPLFVDIRINHAVRAPGFNGNAFQKLLGEKRVLNFKQLGNKRITSKGGPQIQISIPESAEVLLEVIKSKFKQGQRTIFFCSCLYPKKGHTFHCHRYTVAALLYHYATKQKLKARVMEWPGAEPSIYDITVNDSQYKRLSKYPRTIFYKDLASSLSKEEMLSLPPCSILRFNNKQNDPLLFQSDRVQWSESEYTLKAFPIESQSKHISGLMSYLKEERSFWGYDVHDHSTLRGLKEFTQSPLKELIKRR